MNYNSPVLILKNTDYKDADKLVTVFSLQEGKHTVIARGIKKPNSSLRACVQPFCHSLLNFYKRKELDLVTQGKLLNFYGNIRENMELTLQAFYLMELLDKSLIERAAIPRLYHTVLWVLDYMQNQGLNPLVIRYFEMILLVELGYQPVLDACTQCGDKTDRLSAFAPRLGGVLCRSCAHQEGNCQNMNGETLSLLRMLSLASSDLLRKVKASDAALAKVELILEQYLEYQLESKLQSTGTLRRLKQFLS
jgi:DNA repair protein RecO (recombination protein O)